MLRFPNLKVLYLHGNNICQMNQLGRLTLLPNLYSLTLHGFVTLMAPLPDGSSEYVAYVSEIIQNLHLDVCLRY